MPIKLRNREIAECPDCKAVIERCKKHEKSIFICGCLECKQTIILCEKHKEGANA
jgi:hypothetical protein